MRFPLLKIPRLGLGISQTDDITLYSVVPPRLAEDIIWGIGFPPGATRASASNAQPLPPGLGVLMSTPMIANGIRTVGATHRPMPCGSPENGLPGGVSPFS
jgi:hypothetical protein